MTAARLLSPPWLPACAPAGSTGILKMGSVAAGATRGVVGLNTRVQLQRRPYMRQNAIKWRVGASPLQLEPDQHFRQSQLPPGGLGRPHSSLRAYKQKKRTPSGLMGVGGVAYLPQVLLGMLLLLLLPLPLPLPLLLLLLRARRNLLLQSALLALKQVPLALHYPQRHHSNLGLAS